jgi:hypothetical protein
MGILNLHFEKIKELLDSCTNTDQELDIVILGFPELHQNIPLLNKTFGEENLKKSKEKFNTVDDPNYYLIDILKTLYNCKITVVDIEQHTGTEEILDFNHPIPNEYKEKFDFLIDSSCLEHCFNIGQAFLNICDFMKVGGIVTTIAPIYNLNHGYFNINPIFHEDGFLQNGFEILSQNIIDKYGDIVLDFSKKSHPRKNYILTTAIKIKSVDLQFPIQTHKGEGRTYESR